MKYFDKKNNRLIFESSKATPNFWDNLWEMENLKKFILSGKNDRFVSKFTKRFIQSEKSKKILEGGCGRGNLVYSLQCNGYDAYGVDYAKKTIEKIKGVMPELNVSIGNVKNLDFPDAFFDGYWSLGVIEHFFNGYDKIISEMFRTIKPNGYLFLTFPYMSPLRKLKAKLGIYPKFQKKNFNEEYFYQFALDYKKVKRDIEKIGFTLKYKKPSDGIKGLKDEICLLKYPLQKIYNNKNICLRLLTHLISKIFSPISGHVILLIFQKND